MSVSGDDPARTDFLRELTRSHDGFVVWKHLDRSLRGHGDVDALAPAEDVQGIQKSALSVASRTLGATHAITCSHVPDLHLLFFVQPRELPNLFELDVWTRPSRASAPWADPRHVLRFATQDQRSIRRLTAGAEAVMLLVYHLGWHGRNQLTGHDRESILYGLVSDMPSAEAACRLLPPPPARAPLRRVAHALARGEWSPLDVRRTLLGFALAGIAHPPFAARRAIEKARFMAHRECVMFGLMRRHNRQVATADLDDLLTRAEADGHLVTEL